MARHNEVAPETARQGIVLLKNDGVLPLTADTTARIAVIGGHAQVGVRTGTGSSAVVPAAVMRPSYHDQHWQARGCGRAPVVPHRRAR